MKKLLGILVLGLLWHNVSIADDNIYYCVDESVTGFNVAKTGNKQISFQPRKFTAKIDLENGIFETKNFGTSPVKRVFSTRFFTDGTSVSIRFSPDYTYFRSKLLGPVDSITVAYGKCEKF